MTTQPPSPDPLSSPDPTRRADPSGAAAHLATLTSRADGAAYLSDWSLRELRALAAHLGLRGVASHPKADLIDRLVTHTIGYRLASTALRHP
ncbi:hypothetical protein Jiend_17380 [Micromonospora endophytica]|uniref:hypothetical protein n=1 Tax=Micromonospora endophytica TaxID=515350 RepID=UPI000E6975C9|nr:hypothetical protein [Micromonospora endophytica]RIW41469.1 hypothetical protein D3H59_26085 [Micromonospora endophytica]BCJ58316.1 hypothetical protein Jiend_17380 [Micromonospora endophytica]